MNVSNLDSCQSTDTHSCNFRTSVCIVSHNGYGAIAGGKSGFIGGVELQTSLLAKWMGNRGHSVSFLTWDEGGPGDEVIDGVRVIKICRRDAGLPGLRFFYPKWSGLVTAMQKADADVYYHNCGECVTGQIAIWCKMNRRKLIFALASNADCDPSLPEMNKIHEKILFKCGLRLADGVIAQTHTQQLMLKSNFNVDSIVIPMPCQDMTGCDFAPPSNAARRVLWVGRVCPVKRLEWFLELADLSPEWQFDLVGPFDGTGYSEQLKERAKRISNITLHGKVEKERINDFYRRSGVLCCTSIYEGFPNTFLEAWSRGLPVVSTFDPDGVIGRENLGRFVTDVAEMRVAIQELMTQHLSFCECSRNGRKYYVENHNAERVMPRLEQVIHTVLSGRLLEDDLIDGQ
ncbi:MAG: glycosyltransferase family 4 protein [Verrucomicrobiota bacterium]